MTGAPVVPVISCATHRYALPLITGQGFGEIVTNPIRGISPGHKNAFTTSSEAAPASFCEGLSNKHELHPRLERGEGNGKGP